MQKFIIFLKKNKSKYSKEKKYYQTRDHWFYTGEYRGAAHSISNLKYTAPKKIAAVIHNGSNYDYHFIIKELTEEFKKPFTCLGENTKNCITFTVLLEKGVTRIDKNAEKLLKICLIHWNLLIAQNLWQIHRQFLSIIFLKKFIELNVNCTWWCDTCGVKHNYGDCFLEYTNLKDDFIE